MPNLEEVLAVLAPFAEIAPIVARTGRRDGECVHMQRRPEGGYAVLTRSDFQRLADLHARLSASPAAQDRADVAGERSKPDKRMAIYDAADGLHARLQALQEAIEGECDGLAIGLVQAVAILQHVDALTTKEGGQARVPDGWRPVPEEPTEAMHEAAWKWDEHIRSNEPYPYSLGVWRAMLSAVTPPDVQKGETL